MESLFVSFTVFYINDLPQFVGYFQLQLKSLFSGVFAGQRSPGQCVCVACAEVPDGAPSS